MKGIIGRHDAERTNRHPEKGNGGKGVGERTLSEVGVEVGIRVPENREHETDREPAHEERKKKQEPPPGVLHHKAPPWLRGQASFLNGVQNFVGYLGHGD